VTTKRADPPSADPAVRSPPQASEPQIRVAYQPAGRETLEAITGELVPLPGAFERASSSPEISVREGVIERDTLAAIMEEAGAGDSAQESPAPPAAIPRASATDALEVFEMVTYVVRGGDVARLASEGLRRKFVEENLLQRLPVQAMADVERVDVTPWTVQGTLVVRVWCKTKLG
jgi:hypothetical protein